VSTVLREPDAGPRPVRRATLGVAALTLAALNLRPGLASVGPVVPRIRDDLGLSGAESGLLTTIPTLCFGLFAPVSARLAHHFGTERTIVGALALAGVATALRWPAHHPVPLFVVTFALGVGIAFAQTLLPSVVKQRFAARALLVTGAYALSINLGALLGASLSAPATHALSGSWAGSLALWSGLAPLAVLAWVLLAREAEGRTARAPVPGRLPWRSPIAWKLTSYMAGLSIVYIVVLTWVPSRYEDVGYSDNRAALVLTVFTGAQLVGGVIVPPLAHRRPDRRPWLVVSTALVAVGMLGVGLAGASLSWLWAAVGGLGMGGAFPLALTLFVDFASTPAEASRLTAMGFSVGYLVASAGPAVAGEIRDVTGSLAIPFSLLGALSMALTVGVTALRPAGR
jgi:MFS transporter, CP family, cyanate transporter